MIHKALYTVKVFNTEKESLDYIQLYRNDRPYLSFSSEKALFKYYFDHRFSDGDVVFNDARLLDEPLLNQTHATKNILVFHNSHLNGQQIKGSYKFALNHSEKVEKYLILTEKQKKILLAKLH